MANIRQKVNQYLWITLASSFFVLFIIISYLIHGYNMMIKVDQYQTQGEIFAEIVKTNEDDPNLQVYFEKLGDRDRDTSFIYYAPSGEVIFSNGGNEASILTFEGIKGSDWIPLYSKGKERFVLPIKSGAEIHGYLELQIKTSIFNSHLNNLWILLLIFFIAVVLIIVFILSRFSRRFLDPVEDAANTIKELAKGNFKARAPENPFVSTNDLSQSVNTLARSLQQVEKSYDIQQERLITLIENMGSGIVLIDAKGYVSLVNKAFISQFQLQKLDVLDRLYYEVLPYENLIDFIKEIFLIEKNVRKQLVLTFPIERRHFEIYGAPITNNHQKLKGISLVFHDITELKKLEQMRKDFVANVSHELRTPVTSLKGFAETLLDGAMENPDIREKFINIIWKESDRLQSLISDLLELSKIEQENFTLNLQPVNLQDALDDVILLLENKAVEKQIELSSNVIGKPVILGDLARLKQIIINLINNSLNYTLSGGYCSVHIVEKEDAVHFTVQDNGIGIEKEEVPRIFERFYRIDKARSRNSGGTGLGLAIVKHLVDAHKGKITVESEKNKGTTIKIIFPKTLLED